MGVPGKLNRFWVFERGCDRTEGRRLGRGPRGRDRLWRAIEALEARVVLSVPAAPSDLTAGAVSSSRIVIGWRDNATDETEFVVERALAGGSFTPVATLGANVTSYADDGRTPGARYTYRVAARNGDGPSPYSYPIIANALALFQTNPHPEPERVGNYQFGLPANRVDPVTGQRNNVFYEGQTVRFDLRWNGGQATTYEVRNYWGEMVAGGVAPAVGAPLDVPVTKPGWYKLYVYGNTSTPEFGDLLGATTFAIFRNDPNFPVNPAPNAAPLGNTQVIRGVTAMGPSRLNATDVTKPDEMIAMLEPEVQAAKAYYLGRDGVRPRDLLIAFTNGTRDLNDPSRDAEYLAGVRKIVEHFHNDVKVYEVRNEPHYFESAEQMVEETRQLYNVIKSVDPTCRLVGPSIVDLSPGYSLVYLDRFLAAGGGQYIDGFSYHAHNETVGDLATARFNLNNLNAVLGKYGLANIEKWQTEYGAFAALYGTFQPRIQGRWTMLQMLVQEQYNVPKEHNNIWYDQSGFWDVPAFWQAAQDGSLMPTPVVMRVYSEQVFGTKFEKGFDFGPSGNNLYLGNLYKGPGGKAVAAFMSAGSTDGRVALKVTGGAGVLKVTDAMGVSRTVAVLNGQVTLDVPETPVYVDLAAGQTIEVVPQNFGANLASQPGVTLQTSGDGKNPLGGGWQNSITKVTNGKLDTWYTDPSPDGDTWYDHTPAGQQVWFQINLPAAQAVSRVNLFSGAPWSLRGSLLDYELQYDRNGVWTTIERVQEDPKTIGVFSPWTHSTVDSYYSDRWIFQHEFTPVTTSKLRVVAHEMTYGGGATLKVAEAGGQTGFHLMNLREIEVFGEGNAPTGNSAALVGADTQTAGNWKGKYGSEGYVVVGDASQLPAGVSVTPLGHGEWTWDDATGDPRALQRAGSGRIAATWFQNQFTVDVRITDGRAHKLSAYLLDWDNSPRFQQVDVLDGATGAVLHAYTAAGFSGGRYVTWNVEGHVRLRFTNLGQPNAVMSGLFFDPGTANPDPDPDPDPTNRPPVAAAGADGGVPAGQAFSFDGGGSSDPDGDQLSYHWDFGDGTTATGVTATHAFARPGPFTVTLSVSDGRVTSQDALVVTVGDVAPTIAVGGAAEAFEGSAYALTLGALTNPAGHTIAQYVVHWGDGTSDTFTTAGVKSHTYADGPRAASVTVDLVDDYGTHAAAGALSVAVRNVAPTVAVSGGAAFALPLAPLHYAATPGDVAGADVAAGFSYAWSVTRDGLAFGLPIGTRTDLASFGFVPTTTGTFAVTVRVTDKDGGTGEATSTAVVSTGVRNGANFIGEDVATGGTWGGVYGAEGHYVVGDSTAVPAYALMSVTGQNQWTWAPSADGDPRATRRATGPGRLASTIYGDFTIALTFAGTASHSVAVYVLDWDKGSRSQRVDVVDGDSGAVLDTRTVSDFYYGKYLVWNLSGHVKLRFTNLAGYNAVMSGLFFGPPVAAPGDQTAPSLVSRTPLPGSVDVPTDTSVAASFGEDVQASTIDVAVRDGSNNVVPGAFAYDATTRTVTFDPAGALLPSAVYTVTVSGAKDLAGNAMDAASWSFTTAAAAPPGTSATFVREDVTTQGNWKGVYGSDGYNVIGDARAFQAYATVTASGNNSFTWSHWDTSARSLQRASAVSAGRIAGCWYSATSFTVDVDLTDGQAHRLALYFLDFDSNRQQSVTLTDATTGAVLDARTMADFNQGKYLVYDVTGHVRITVTNLGSLNAVMSGLFLG